MLLPNIVAPLKRLQAQGYLLAIVSNQDGIRRYVSLISFQHPKAFFGCDALGLDSGFPSYAVLQRYL
ncbi:MAG: hypothetical protein LJE69_08970 [Thiohalocapsa sp.]|uniref:hypothetical protein n=1 Tax=Thiohalocapsa sp. TaxID=2497641 RepID=UPI0025E5EB94|nr:hypothetical protein [Thiohalocapsa sp.]MCG6941370.1 hypothetical protein [Thiohalocapsa sp.]